MLEPAIRDLASSGRNFATIAVQLPSGQIASHVMWVYADDDQLSHDPVWLGLNDRYFVYGSGGRFSRAPGVGRFSAELPGFVSRYATSALEEDKAETFAMRMTAPRKFATLTAADPILRAKAAALEAQLRKLSPSLDDRFFSAVDRY